MTILFLVEHMYKVLKAGVFKKDLLHIYLLNLCLTNTIVFQAKQQTPDKKRERGASGGNF